VTFSKSSSVMRSRGPLLGEHTTEILTSLGYDRAAVEKLRSKRVV